jgi:hypothetical protein
MALWTVTYTTSVYAQNEKEAALVLQKNGFDFPQDIKATPFNYGNSKESKN